MSTKCTIMSGRSEEMADVYWAYHFYYDYKDSGNHLDFDGNNDMAKKNFLDKIAKILGQCPFSDSGIYMINLKNGKSTKIGNKTCSLLDEKNKPKKAKK